MTATIEGIRQELKGMLATVQGLHAYARWPGQLDFPAAFPLPDTEPFGEDFDGDSTIAMQIVVLAAPGEAVDYDRGQLLLDRFLERSGNQSIVAALRSDEAEDALEALGVGLVVQGWGEYSMRWEHAGRPCWGAALRLEVMR